MVARLNTATCPPAEPDEQFGRERAEVIVDTVTFVVCGSVGLDVGGESISYVAGWGEDGALDAVMRFAETIDALACRL